MVGLEEPVSLEERAFEWGLGGFVIEATVPGARTAALQAWYVESGEAMNRLVHTLWRGMHLSSGPVGGWSIAAPCRYF